MLCNWYFFLVLFIFLNFSRAFKDFKVNEKRIAILTKVEWGKGITAIPWYDNVEELSKWLGESGFYQLSYKVDKSGSFYIREFTLGVVVTAGPLLTYAQRSQWMNEFTNNKYFSLKREWEQEENKQVQKTIQDKLYEMHKKYGFKTLKTSEQFNFNRKMFVFFHDENKKKTKRNAWQKQCEILCEQVLKQRDSELIWDWHLEFSLIKDINDSPNEGEFLSREPLHVADIFFEIPLDKNDRMHEAIVNEWKTKFQKHYQIIFTKLKQKHLKNVPTTLKLVDTFESSGGNISSWQVLLHKKQIARDASDFNFPKISHVNKVIPQRIDKWNVDYLFNEVAALQHGLKGYLSGPIDKIDFIYRRVSPLYQFRAVIENMNEWGDRRLEAYTGHSETSTTQVNFLDLLLTMKMSHQLKEKLHDIILNVWTPLIEERFQEMITQKMETSPIRTIFQQQKKTKLFSFLKNHVNSTFFTSSHSRKPTNRYKKADFQLLFDQDTRIEKILIDYIGGLDLVCYHEISQNVTNQLAFLVKPVTAVVQRVDGMTFQMELESSCTVIAFFDHGLWRIFNEARPTFQENLHSVNPNLHDLLYHNLFSVLSAEKNMSLFYRNTCKTDAENRMISSQKIIQLYDLNNLFKIWKLPDDEQSLHLLLNKCYSRVLPSVCVKQKVQESSDNGTFMECSQIPGLQSYSLVERSVFNQ